MFDDSMIKAALAGLATVLAAGPLGCFIIWRRMAYFGDAIAHASLLGVALALTFSFSVFLGVTIVALLSALLVDQLHRQGHTLDTLLGVVAHGALAVGLMSLSFDAHEHHDHIDLDAYLLGDILTVTTIDVILTWLGALAVVSVLYYCRHGLLTSTLSHDLAYADGHNPARDQLILFIALALTTAIAIKIVGVLLIGALLLIPGATARVFARSPQAMIGLAILFGAVAVIAGLAAAHLSHSAAGPMIVSIALLGFMLASLMAMFRR